MIKTAIFDLDGTLADTIPLTLEALRRAAYDFTGVEYSDDMLLQKFGPVDTEIIKDLVSEKDREASVELYVQYFEKLFDSYVKHFDGIIDLFEFLKDKEINVGLYTGRSMRVTKIILKSIGIEDYFNEIASGDDTKVPKPDPEGINLVLKRLGATPSESFYAGDFDVDIEASRRAGVKSILALWSSTGNEELIKLNPDAYFKSIGSFVDWLRNN